MVERMNSPVLGLPSVGRLSDRLFFIFVVDEEPQSVQLTALDLELLQQNLIERVGMPSNSKYGIEKGKDLGRRRDRQAHIRKRCGLVL